MNSQQPAAGIVGSRGIIEMIVVVVAASSRVEKTIIEINTYLLVATVKIKIKKSK